MQLRHLLQAHHRFHPAQQTLSRHAEAGEGVANMGHGCRSASLLPRLSSTFAGGWHRCTYVIRCSTVTELVYFHSTLTTFLIYYNLQHEGPSVTRHCTKKINTEIRPLCHHTARNEKRKAGRKAGRKWEGKTNCLIRILSNWRCDEGCQNLASSTVEGEKVCCQQIIFFQNANISRGAENLTTASMFNVQIFCFVNWSV